jgi:hypothetical protein
MSINSLLNQTVTIYNNSGRTAYGRPSFSTATASRARVQRQNKQVQSYSVQGDKSQVVISNIMLILPPTVTIAVDDKVTYSSIDYKVLNVYQAVDGQGNVNHLEVDVIKWHEA